MLQTLKMLAKAKDPIQLLYNSSFTDKLVKEFKENGNWFDRVSDGDPGQKAILCLWGGNPGLNVGIEAFPNPEL